MTKVSPTYAVVHCKLPNDYRLAYSKPATYALTRKNICSECVWILFFYYDFDTFLKIIFIQFGHIIILKFDFLIFSWISLKFVIDRYMLRIAIQMKIKAWQHDKHWLIILVNLIISPVRLSQFCGFVRTKNLASDD